MRCSALAGGNTANHLRAISKRLLGMECAGGTRHTLRDDLGVFVDKDAHIRLLNSGVRLVQRGINCLTCDKQFFDRIDADREVTLGFVIKRDFDDLFNAACANDDRYADI